MESAEKKKSKFNLIDAIVIIVIIAAVAFVAVKVFGGSLFASESEYIVTYFFEEVPEFAADVIYVGDKVVDEQKDTDLGVVTEVTTDDSRTYSTDSDGKVICSGKPYYKSVMIVTKVTGTDYDNGVIVDGSKYGVGHSLTLRVGKAKVYGRVAGIEKVEG